MATSPSTLRIVAAEPVGPTTRRLEIALPSGAPFAFRGGQYIIVNTGVVLPDGKLVKRAYSLLPVPGDRGRARILVKRIGAGPGSNALHDAEVGRELLFSGPWGKLVPEGGLADRTLVVATDTGITAALGIVEQSRVLEAQNAALVLWLRGDDETFLDEAEVERRVESAGVRFAAATIPRVHQASRIDAAYAHAFGRAVEVGARVVLAAGDGAVLFAARERLLAASIGVEEVRLDAFFNNPERKAS